VKGDPTEDVLVFRDPSNVQLVLKDGVSLKDQLATA
jgi:imidazolonepropionase-like amidohydrolase